MTVPCSIARTARRAPRVLLIGPDAEVQDAMHLLLEGCGCNVRREASVGAFVGEDGDDLGFDLALVDFYPLTPRSVPEVRALRAALGPHSALIVALTPNVPEGIDASLMAAGCSACMPMSALPDRIEAIIAWAAAAARTANAPGRPRSPRGEADR